MLAPELRRAVAEEGYVIPTPVQEMCIGHLLEGRDLIGTAQTGTGKTAAFALPMLQVLAREPKFLGRGMPRALVLAPTRELAAQIGDSIGTYGRHLRLSHTVVYGGVSQSGQVQALQKGVDILVATPGRLLDLIGQGFINLGKVEIFVLDEGDRMLDMGFIPDIRRVLSHLPRRRQTSFFSATMPAAIVDLARSMVTDPVRVAVTPESPAVELISQKVLFVEKADKDALLVSVLRDPLVCKALVFTRMKHTANKLVRKLSAQGIQGAAIHGNKSQSVRTRSLGDFRSGSCRVLVATDVAARGLDVDDITHVINYDLPVEAETYVHRIGRTARAGASGDAISFCCAEDVDSLRDIELLLGRTVPVSTEHDFHCDAAYRSSHHAPHGGGQGQVRRAGAPGTVRTSATGAGTGRGRAPYRRGTRG